MGFDPPPPAYNPDNNAGYSHSGPQPDNDTEAFSAAGFDDHHVRQRFIKKVTGILGIQLLLTFGLVLLTAGSGAFQAGAGLYAMPLVWTSMIGSMVLLFGAMCCCQPMLRKTPHNFIFLTVWTLMEAHLISFITLQYKLEIIIQAMGITAGIVLSVSCLVWFTPFDFSKMLPIMGIVLWGWVLTVFVTRLVGVQWNMTLYCGIGVTIFTIFLAIDLKLVMGGGKYSLSEDDYVMGAIIIYLDIINIFLYVLQFLNSD